MVVSLESTPPSAVLPLAPSFPCTAIFPILPPPCLPYWLTCDPVTVLADTNTIYSDGSKMAAGGMLEMLLLKNLEQWNRGSAIVILSWERAVL